MSINLVSPCASPSANLIYDPIAGATQKMTTMVVGGVTTTVSAALEVQSTTGGILFPRMTTAQRLALNVVDGMEVYDSTVGAFFYRQAGVWAQSLVVPQGIQYASGALTLADMQTFFSVPTQILAAPGAGFMYVVSGFLLNVVYGTALFTNGSAISLQYGDVSNPGAGFNATATIPATLLTANANNKSSYVGGAISSTTTANGGNAPLSITAATADFAVGTGGSAVWQVWYAIVPVL